MLQTRPGIVPALPLSLPSHFVPDGCLNLNIDITKRAKRDSPEQDCRHSERLHDDRSTKKCFHIRVGFGWMDLGSRELYRACDLEGGQRNRQTYECQ
jgi:hypothetical protein